MDDEAIKQLIQLLEEMGATSIKFQDEIGTDSSLSFVFNHKKVEISGTWHNDDTAGLFVEITSASADNVFLKITAPAECTNCHKKPLSGFLHFVGDDEFLCADCVEKKYSPLVIT